MTTTMTRSANARARMRVNRLLRARSVASHVRAVVPVGADRPAAWVPRGNISLGSRCRCTAREKRCQKRSPGPPGLRFHSAHSARGWSIGIDMAPCPDPSPVSPLVDRMCAAYGAGGIWIIAGTIAAGAGSGLPVISTSGILEGGTGALSDGNTFATDLRINVEARLMERLARLPERRSWSSP